MSGKSTPKDSTGDAAVKKGRGIPVLWSVTDVSELPKGVKVTLNHHIERREPDKLRENLREDKEYFFTYEDIDAVADLAHAEKFAIPNLLGKAARQRDELNGKIWGKLQKAINKKMDANDIDMTVFLCLSQEDGPFAWRLEMVALLEAFIIVANRRHIGYQAIRY